MGYHAVHGAGIDKNNTHYNIIIIVGVVNIMRCKKQKHIYELVLYFLKTMPFNIFYVVYYVIYIRQGNCRRRAYSKEATKRARPGVLHPGGGAAPRAHLSRCTVQSLVS